MSRAQVDGAALAAVLAGDCVCGHPISNHKETVDRWPGCVTTWLDETVAWRSCDCTRSRDDARVAALVAALDATTRVRP
jgi:hypothetical protein